MAGPFNMFPVYNPVDLTGNPMRESMGRVMDALAEEARRERELRMARQWEREKEVARLKEKYADNAREEQRIKAQDQLTRDGWAAVDKRAEATRKAKLQDDARGAVPKVQDLLSDGDETGGRAIGEPLGMTIARRQAELDPFDPVDPNDERRPYELRMPYSDSVLYVDPTARRRAKQERNARMADEFQKAVGPSFGDKHKGIVDEQTARMRTETWDPEKEDPFAAASAERGRREGQEGMDRRAATTARLRGAAKPMTPGEIADNERADVGAFSADYGRWEDHNGIKKLTEDYDKFGTMASQAQAYKGTKDIVAQRATLYTAARLITGPGVLTPQEYQNTVQKTAGITAALLSKIKKEATGDIDEAEWAAMEKFVDNANLAIRQRAVRAVRNFDKKYGPTSFYTRKTPDQVAAERASLMERFGITDDDLATPRSTVVAPTRAEKAELEEMEAGMKR